MSNTWKSLLTPILISVTTLTQYLHKVITNYWIIGKISHYVLKDTVRSIYLGILKDTVRSIYLGIFSSNICLANMESN